MTDGTNNINVGGKFISSEGEDISFRNHPENQGVFADIDVGFSETENEAAPKAYVDAIASGVDVKFVAKAASTSPVVLASQVENGDSLDQVVLFTGEIILIKDQADLTQNGLYYVSQFKAPVRVTSPYIIDNMVLYVEQGTVNKEKFYQITGTFTGPGGTPNYGVDNINVTEIVLTPLVPPVPPGSDNDQTYRVQLTHLSAASTVIGLIENTQAVTEITVRVTQPFDGANPTLTIGDDGHGVSYLMSDELNDLKTVGAYDDDVSVYYTANTNLKVYFDADGSTQGSVEVLVTVV